MRDELNFKNFTDDDFNEAFEELKVGELVQVDATRAITFMLYAPEAKRCDGWYVPIGK